MSSAIVFAPGRSAVTLRVMPLRNGRTRTLGSCTSTPFESTSVKVTIAKFSEHMHDDGFCAWAACVPAAVINQSAARSRPR